VSFYGGFKTFIEWLAVRFVRFFGNNTLYTAEEMKTPRGWLKLLNVICGYLALGFFSRYALLQWQRIVCPENVPFKERIVCFFPAVLPCAMIAVIGIVYALSRYSAKKELDMSEKLFPQGRLPADWIIPTDRIKITAAVGLFLLSYIVTAKYVDRSAIVSGLMFVIACNDLNTLRWIRKHVAAYFRNPDYAPVEGEKDSGPILKRRGIIQEYFYANPQYWKEAGRVAGCAIAWLVARRGHRATAYLVLLSTLVLNEIVTAKWRAHRDREWLTVKDVGPTPSAIGKGSAP
jgi:hypothetical protein